MSTQTKKHTVTRGPWVFKWEAGSRLADVYHVSKPDALDCVQVGDYNWERGFSTGTVADLRHAASEWVKESGPDYTRELPYL